ncbi:MAG TPA: peptidoglycan-binding domain-containing protein [Bryobacteraceae bacterium]
MAANNNTEVPVGKGRYVVKAGDCIRSVAYEHGLLWQTIYDHPENQDLKQTRDHFHILLPGDRLTVPPIQQKKVGAATEKRHVFKLVGAPEIFQMRLLEIDDTPRPNVSYVLIVGKDTFSGKTDEEGKLSHAISPDAKQGRLIVLDGTDQEEIELRLGDLNPKSTTTGAQARLTNLGIDSGPIDGIPGPKTRKAVRLFQKFKGLHETGELDDNTLQELEKSHGS